MASMVIMYSYLKKELELQEVWYVIWLGNCTIEIVV
jgi:hypothetical protein